MKTENITDTSKRKFLGGAALTAGVVIAPGILLQTVNAKSDDQAVTNKVRWGMLIDTNKCADGCTDCVTACNTENGITGHDRPETDSQWIRKVTLKDKQIIWGYHFEQNLYNIFSATLFIEILNISL